MSRLVSVIIPCYQQAAYLAASLESLRAQTHSEWEAIIVDDGSTDNTASVASASMLADTRIRYIWQPNAGVSAARNRGLSLARGKYIQFLDADDLLAPEKLMRQVEYLDSNASIDVVYGTARYFNDGKFGVFFSDIFNQNDGHDWIAELWSDPRSFLGKLTSANLLPICSPLVRFSSLQRVGYFDKSLRGVEDWDLWMRLARSGCRFQYVDQGSAVVAYIRVHASSATHDLEKMQNGEFSARLLWHEHILDAESRFINRKRLLQLACRPTVPGRVAAFRRVLAVLSGGRERLTACIVLVIGAGGFANPAMMRVREFLPARVHAWLTGQGIV